VSAPPASGLKGHIRGRLGAFQLDAAFDIAPTGVTALIGPSGSGKTTLLRCIAGLTRLSGRLTLGDEVWQDERLFMPTHRRPVGVVFQDAALLAHLSVTDNLTYGARRSRAPAGAAMDEVVQLLGLEALLQRSTAHLSGGERQRVALGRALLSRPRILLMDEPLSSLDADAKAEILPYLDRLHQALAIPILYVSHDPREVGRLADRVLVMRDGAIVEASAMPLAAGEQPGARAAAEARLAAMDGRERDDLALAALLAGLKP
jgi:molybdate transport system ATP-binding protein